MKSAKFVLIGAGSSSFTTAVLCGLLRSDEWAGSTVALVDIDPETLEIIEKLARKIVAQQGNALEIVASTERRDVLEGADYVTTTISVGGDDAWQADLNIPAAHGVVQSVADTVGIGGMSRAFRHAPVLVDIAGDMEELCPDATLFNYSNPMMVNTRAVTRETSIRCVGLCIGCELLRRDLCRIIKADPAASWLWAGGINHFSFGYRFLVDGRDAYPLVRARLAQAAGEAAEGLREMLAFYPSARAEADAPYEGRNPFCAELLEATGYYPGPGDSHVAEFLPHFIRTEEDRRRYGLDLYDIERKRQHTVSFLEKFRSAAESSDPVDVDGLIGSTTAEEAQVIEIIRAVRNGGREMFFVNLPNRGQIPNLPEDAVVEGPALTTPEGLVPLVLGELPEPIRGWTDRWIDWGELAIDAALSGNRETAVQCLAADPGCIGLPAARRILDELLAANGRHMKYFAQG